jgi:hypothetical protein
MLIEHIPGLDKGREHVGIFLVVTELIEALEASNRSRTVQPL